jgi:1-acyl-sn-glycerol-3-phosphate acyltransferase
MQNIVIEKPYVPVPPYHGRLWPRMLTTILPGHLRRKLGITRVDCIHTDRLTASIAAGHGILLTPNHSRDDDPLVLGMLTRAVHCPFFIIASWHLFMQTRVQRFLLRRAGAFSIYREGIDRAAINTSVEILAAAERPLVIFPEGVVSRTNDKLNDLMDGTALIARSAAKKGAKQDPPRKIVIHPIALRYRFQGDIEAAIAPVLDEIENRLSWRNHRDLPATERIYRTGNALLTLKELEFLGQAHTGDIGPRLRTLIDSILVPIEQEWLQGPQEGSVPARVKHLRSVILPDMTKNEIDEKERQRRGRQLADLYLAQQLDHYPPDYVRSNPSPERLLETVERFEEDLTDRIRVHGELHASITVGNAIEVPPVREGRGGDDPIMEQIKNQLEEMLGIQPK